MSTNGTLISRKIAERIKECGIEYVGVSLDGATEETHDTIRNKHGCFEKSLRALKTCREAGIKTCIRITVTTDNAHEINPLIDLARELRVPRFCVYWLVPSGSGRVIYNKQITVEEASRIFDVLYQRAEELKGEEMEFLTVDAPQDRICLLNKLKESGNAEYDNAQKLLQCTGDSCSAGDRVANVDPSGNIYPCQFVQQEEFRIGNVRDQKFSTIWNDSENPVLKAFQKKRTCSRESVVPVTTKICAGEDAGSGHTHIPGISGPKIRFVRSIQSYSSRGHGWEVSPVSLIDKIH